MRTYIDTINNLCDETIKNFNVRISCGFSKTLRLGVLKTESANQKRQIKTSRGASSSLKMSGPDLLKPFSIPVRMCESSATQVLSRNVDGMSKQSKNLKITSFRSGSNIVVGIKHVVVEFDFLRNTIGCRSWGESSDDRELQFFFV